MTSPPAQRFAIRPSRAVASVVRGFARPTSGERRVCRRRHRDQRARRRPLRADRGRGRAGRRRRAPRHIRLAGADGTAAVARDPALHRHHAGDGRHRARRRARCSRSWASCCAAGSWWPTRRASTAAYCAHAFERCGIDWPKPPVLCTVQLARRFAPLSQRRALAPLADSLGIEVTEVHRALPDALTCARVLCALFPRLCANAATVGEALEALKTRRRAAQDRARRADPAVRAARPVDPPRRPGRVHLPRRPRQARSTWASRSRCARGRGRTSARRRAGPSAPRSSTTGPPTRSSGALVLENRLIKQWKPAGQQDAQAHRPLRATCAAGSTSPTRCSRSPPSPRPGTRSTSGPLGSRTLAQELADQLTSLYRLRHCGRRLQDARAPVGLRPDGPLRVALPRRPRPERLPPPGRPRARPLRASRRAARRCSRSSTRACARRPPTAATSAPPRCCAGASGSPGCSSDSRASCAPPMRRPGCVLAGTRSRTATTRSGWCAGALVDWGALPGAPSWLERTGRPSRVRRAARSVPADEVDEIRIVASWVADGELPELALDAGAGRGRAAEVRRADHGAACARSTARLRFHV